jgi:trk system potassium uptake protein TrkH
MTAHGDRVLMVAVRPPVVLKYLGQVLLVFAALSCVPLAAALVLGKAAFALRLGILVAVTLVLSLPLSRLPTPRQIQWNEALCVTALAFLLTPLAMSAVLAADGIPLLDAWFEAVSGVTTTGLSPLGTVDGLSPLFLFTRAWTQWYGGLGIAVLSVALIMRHHASSPRLLESSGETATAETAGTHARRVFAVYLALTLAGVLLVWALQGDLFVAATHTLAAVSTGGFAVFDDSLAGMSVAPRAAVTLLCLLGAVSLPLYYHARRDGFPVLLRDPELRALVVALLAVSGAVGLLLHLQGGLSWGAALGHGLLLGASAQTTAGFSSLDVATLAPATQLILIFAMFTGGCSGSTAGGVKLVRVLVLLRLTQLALRRTAAPARAVLRSHLGGERLEQDVIANALLLMGLWVLVVTVSWFPFLLYGYDPLRSLFEVVSATSTVGLSTGITGPGLEAPLKVLLSLDMLFGRVEIVALLVVLYPPTWLGRRRRNQ